MKAITSLFFAAALATAGVAGTTDSQAARGGSSGGGGGHSSGGHLSGGSHGSGHWGGGSQGSGRWGGGHYYGGARYWGPSWGLYVGAPLFFGSYYWGYPYWGYPYDYYYPRTVVVDRAYPAPAPYPEGVMEQAPTTEVPMTQGAPSQGPAYMNFCASANAYYPKVTSCPEGWKFLPSR